MEKKKINARLDELKAAVWDKSFEARQKAIKDCLEWEEARRQEVLDEGQPEANDEV